ncbi:MAG: ceramidase domain-containing protein [Bacteroidetes bacterium]|nr:ceramidase domain-containing protein [Bacteroidota bacterium]
MENSQLKKIGGLILLSIAACTGLFLLQPVCQDTCYHQFADSRSLSTISNYWNVLSNIPFLGIGAAGMIISLLKSKTRIRANLRMHYFLFFLGIFLTGIGSGYYHFNPNNNTLVWDRLPMTISFMSFFAIIIAEYITVQYSRILLFALLFIGVGSVIYWQYTETMGCGDLRMYMAVQFLPMLLIPIILVIFKAPHYPSKQIWFMLLVYVLAKVCETYDKQLFSSLQVISGHTVKHFLAAIAPILFLQGIKQKENPK